MCVLEAAAPRIPEPYTAGAAERQPFTFLRASVVPASLCISATGLQGAPNGLLREEKQGPLC